MTKTSSLLEKITLRPVQVSQITMENVTLFYGQNIALWRCSTTFKKQNIVAIAGPNGAGKSTILRLLAILQKPSEGTVFFEQEFNSWVHRQSLRKEIGLVAHDSLVYLELTGRENLLFYQQLYQTTESRILLSVDMWLELVGLTKVSEKPVGTYSRGMRQRLSIARALLNEPSIVLLDEPLTGLDQSGKAFFWDILAWLRREKRIVIFVTHHLDVPKNAIDQALLLRNGRVRYDGPIEESLQNLYEKWVLAKK